MISDSAVTTESQETNDPDAPDVTCGDAGKPMRADARRNYDKVLTAARDAFAERGAETSLEGIARRAGVGIGTLYRHFPTRQALLEAVYVGEVDQLCNRAEELNDMPPWDAFAAAMEGTVRYLATKQALAQELLDYVGRDSELFLSCRKSLARAIEPLMERAQEAKVLRADTNFAEVIQLFGGIAKIQTADAAQLERLIQIALDGLRYRD